MKVRKVIGMAITTIICTLAMSTILMTKSEAANSSYVLGITNIRESGAAYGMELKTDGTPTKKLWKIVSYTNANSGSGTINYNNAFYCLKAEHGFVNNDTSNSTSVTSLRKTYSKSINMKTASKEAIELLSKISCSSGCKDKTDMTQETYNKIMWILDNMYLPKASDAESYKNILMEEAGINDYDVGVLLTDDEIEMIQQLAIWYFTNTNDTKCYHPNCDGEGEVILPTILQNQTNNKDESYKSWEDKENNNLYDDDKGKKHQNQAEDLYRYFIDNANDNSNYSYQQTVAVPISLETSNCKAVEENGKYIIGPFKITGDINKVNISELEFKDEKGNKINLGTTNKLLNSSKGEISGDDIKSVASQGFYISLPKETTIKAVNLSVKGSYGITDTIFYTTNDSSYLTEQPVVLVERTTKPVDLQFRIALPDVKELDLALRKSITKINGIAPTKNRLPIVDATKLENGQNTTAKYNHPKNDLLIGTNQEIEYTITVYNEGSKNGYAQEIKDYLPAGIKFVELVSGGDNYKAEAKENSDGTTTITITNTGKHELQAYTTGTPKNESFTIKCKVTETVGTTDKRLVNIAEITKYYDSEENKAVDEDRDSQTTGSGLFPADKKNNSYYGNGQEGDYVKGQQDDDDFEPVVLPAKYFDLSLRKFLTEKNGEKIEPSREPQVDITKLATGESTTATYNHSKVPVSIKVGDIVTYTIRVYNEGQLDGYVNQITDHLPEQLEFLPEDEDNVANGWYLDDTDPTLRTIKTDHLSKTQDTDNLIKAFDGTKLDYKDISVKCRVKQTAISGQKITNIAEITDFSDAEGNTVVDRDSTSDSLTHDNSKEQDNMPNDDLPTDENLPTYKDDEINQGEDYIPGQQDDDDFEKLQIEIFDLALRKFITAVDDKDITNRIPQLSLENDEITYNHTKDPVEVKTGNVVVYTLRIFNEGEVAGYASEITDDLPEGLEFLPENELNETYRWKMIDASGNETTDVTKAVKVTTDYLSKEQERTEGGNLIKAFDKQAGITSSNPDYKDVKIAFEVTEPNTSDRILTNVAQISDDTDEFGNPVTDKDSTPGNNEKGEDDIDEEHVKLIYFDLALRKFITKVENLDINNRYPKLSLENGKIKYEHTKDPVQVANGNTVIYTLRIYNEGKIAGYAQEVTDNLPEGLEFLPENELNKTYRWKMIDEDGEETTNVAEAVKITTDYLSKEQESSEGENLLQPFNSEAGITDKNPDYRDVKVAFKVIEPNTSDRVLINTAEISEDADKDGNPIDDADSTPGNDEEGEDDRDIEKVVVQYFDLSLKKWVSQVIIIEDGKQTVTETNHTGDENPEPVVKVDLKDKKLNKVTVKFAYTIKVTNEGQLEGYAKEVKDYIPSGLKFVKEDNPDWVQGSNNEVTTDKLKDTLLKPGQSATVGIILTWENSDKNLGTKINVAEISKDYNAYGAPDIDSTPGNNKAGEDDIDDAPVVLSVKTGQIVMYFTLTGIVLGALAGGIILIKKYVL